MAATARKLEARLAGPAKSQHGAVTRVQLLAIGVTRAMIEHRIASGRLVPVYPGVYLVGPVTTPLGPLAAAILACRPRAFLSHATSAGLWRVPAPESGLIEITVVDRWQRSPAGVRVYTMSRLPRGELRRHEGLPIASPSLTLLDLAGRLAAEELAAALNEARVQRIGGQPIVTDRELRATLAAHPNRRGARALRALLDSERGPRITRSEAERRALVVMRAHGIEPDASDVQIGPYLADFLFERERLVVEVDGYRYHSTPKRFADDRRRSAYLAARGLQVYPLTWDDLGKRAARAMGLLSDTLRERRRLFGGA